MYTAIIADDAELICDAISSALRSAVPELKIAGIFHNGADAYEYIKNNHVDILLLDIEMPGKSGLDIAQLINEQKKDSYVIILTAYRNFDYAKRAIDCNVDAFLTKPFSYPQLIDKVNKAIDLFDQENATKADNCKMYRSFLQSLCNDHKNKFPRPELRLCQNTAPISELQCTEVTLKDEGLCPLLPQTQRAILQTLTKTVENDTKMQCSFFMEFSEDTIKLLIFSKQEPDLSILPDAQQIISCYTGNSPEVTLKSYSSFNKYYDQLSYTREMDDFFKLVASGDPKQAKVHLISYIQALPQEQLVNFGNFLTNNYQIAADTTDRNGILQCVDLLFNQTVGTHSGNYIVDSAKRHIEEHYSSSSLSLESTADALSICRVYLSKLFKKYTNQTFSEYLLNLRMEQAKKLLQTTHMPTTEIATAVGYTNPAYFRSSFKTRIGMTPRQYRQLQPGKDENL